jgi:hypothetical protein
LTERFDLKERDTVKLDAGIGNFEEGAACVQTGGARGSWSKSATGGSN